MSDFFLAGSLLSIGVVITAGLGTILWILIEVLIDSWKDDDLLSKILILSLAGIATFGVLFLITWGLGQ